MKCEKSSGNVFKDMGMDNPEKELEDAEEKLGYFEKVKTVTKAIYAGSFDPITDGHMWVMEKAMDIFDELVIVIGVNPDKKYTFSPEERSKMIKESLAEIGMTNYKVGRIDKQLLVNYADELKIPYIIRGIRNSNDFEYEKGMANINSDINHSIDTLYLIPPRELCEVSSSLVKGLVGFSGWENVVNHYVPIPVMHRLKELNEKGL